MKKNIIAFLIFGSLCGVGNATEIKPYVGFDIAHNDMSAKDLKLNQEWYNDELFVVKDNKNSNLGLDAGVKFDFENKMFLSAELYYRTGKLMDFSYMGKGLDIYFDEHIDDWRYTTGRLKIKNTFGVKLYLGYKFDNNLNTFASFGLNRMNYKHNNEYEREVYNFYTNTVLGWKKSEMEFEKNNFAPSFGFGVGYSITKNIETKLSYEFLNYKVKDNIIEKTVKLNTHSVRFGMNYIF